MALNVTTAVFRPGFNIATASPSLVQWDQGQMLQFEGVELPSAYQVEFTNAVTVQAITMIGNENGVEIPNELLQQSFPINAYIVLHETAEDRETEYWATIYVKARQQPREETPDPEQISVIDQTIAALQEGVAEAQAASQAVQNMGVEAETLPEGSEATVEKTVDPETGEVTLGFGIPEGRHGATGATPDIQIGTVTTGAPGSQADASITGTREEPRLNLTIPQGPQGDAGVTSVNGKTGAVVLSASDVGAKPASYEAPVSSVNGKTGAVVLGASDVGAKPASYEAPVSSVNGKTGAVVLSASDVGAKPASYEAPVSSVNEKTGAVVLGAGDIGYDGETTYPDASVGKELTTINSALTSLSAVTEIIDTASGAIASFPDGAGLPMRSLVAEINPVQAGTGDPSPDNIRPITGHTGLSVEVTGANVWDEEWEVGTINPSTGNNENSSSLSRSKNYIRVRGGETYYFAPLNRNIYIRKYDANKNYIGYEQASANTTTGSYVHLRTLDNDVEFVRIVWDGNTYNHDISINYPSTDTSYHAYTGEAISVTFPQTVYGGTDEVIGGNGTSTMGEVDLGELNWTYNSSNNRFDVGLPDAKSVEATTVANAYCSIYKAVTFSQLYGGADFSFAFDARGLRIRDTRFTTVADFKAAVTGQKLVYELGTPTTFTHEGQSVDTLVGQNNVWVDTGDVTVTYQASIKGYIDKVLAS